MRITIGETTYVVAFRRRRYDTTTYTWASVALNQESVSLGDPWPAVTPKQREVEASLRRVLGERGIVPGPAPSGPEQGY